MRRVGNDASDKWAVVFSTFPLKIGTFGRVGVRISTPASLSTAGINFNEALWSSQSQFEQAYLYLSAHYLVESLKASSQGISSQYGGNTTSKSVGNVSENYEIPDKVKNNPFFAGLYTTRYGAIYVGMLQPRIIGNVVTMRGMTTP